MNKKERILDIEKSERFAEKEIKQKNDAGNNAFSSIEFYIIIHFTNEELYYSNHERETFEEHAEEIINTEKGVIYCFN
jgi:hypothetical protein